MTSSTGRGALLLALVAVGGAGGALTRWLLDTRLTPDSPFPWVTLGINVAGAFALGALPLLPPVRRSRAVATAIGPGFLGGFTTVSAWAGQVRDLADAGDVLLAGLYLAVTLAAGLAAASLGRRVSHRPEPLGAVE